MRSFCAALFFWYCATTVVSAEVHFKAFRGKRRENIISPIQDSEMFEKERFPINTPEEAPSSEGPVLPPGASGERPGEAQKNFKNPEGGVPRKSAFTLVPTLLGAVYLFSSVCFILCLRGLSTRNTAKRGNILGIAGILAAICITSTEKGFDSSFISFSLLALPAAVLGVIAFKYFPILQIPELIALLHSFVGLAAILVGLAEYHSPSYKESPKHLTHLIEIFVAQLIAGVTFSGSLVASGKLHGVFSGEPLRIRGRHAINSVVLLAIAILGWGFCVFALRMIQTFCLYFSLLLTILLGAHLIFAMKGDDMAIVISMLNSLSGFAAAASGFMLDNTLLIIAGSLIGSSGAILSYIMCNSMNCNIFDVIFEADEAGIAKGSSNRSGPKPKQTTCQTVAEKLLEANKILVVPGYGAGSSNCTTEMGTLEKLLDEAGIQVFFAVHPVAGRMPGQIDLFLSQGGVSHDRKMELSEANKNMNQFDVALVVGANDTVHYEDSHAPKRKSMKSVEVWKAKRVFVLKRSMGLGFAKVDNQLFYLPKTQLLLGDAKGSLQGINTSISDLSGDVKRPVDKGFIKVETHKAAPDPVKETPIPTPKKILLALQSGVGKHKVGPIAPSSIEEFKKIGFRVLVEEPDSEEGNFTRSDYEDSAEVVTTEQALDNIEESDIIVQVYPPESGIIRRLNKKHVLISYIWPERNLSVVKELVQRNVTVLAVGEVPRTAEYQTIDFRSSISNLQGYRAALEALMLFPRFGRASSTAAGFLPGAKVFVIGAGIAGLQAIATMRSFGARVYATDIREAAKEEVESCGGTFVSMDSCNNAKEEADEDFNSSRRRLISQTTRLSDIVICCAKKPGDAPPKLISKEMVTEMKPGSVIIDLAFESANTSEKNWGGNCQCSVEGTTNVKDVLVVGRSAIEASMPMQATELFSANLFNLLDMLGGASFDDAENIKSFREFCDLLKGSTGEIKGATKKQTEDRSQNFDYNVPASLKQTNGNLHLLDTLLSSDIFFSACLMLTCVVVGIFGALLSTLELNHLFYFTLALIVGYYSVWSVTPSLHTPLMSVTNALSGVIIVGAMLEFYSGPKHPSTYCALGATFLAAITIAAGFGVTKKTLDQLAA